MNFSDQPTTKQPAESDERVERGQSDRDEPGVTGPVGAAQLDKAYPWLLGGSLLLSAILCWMYVTKPVVIGEGEGAGAQADISSAPKAGAGKAPLMPSDNALPGSDTDKQAMNSARRTKSLARARPSTYAPGWESTNLKVQHILSVDTGSTELEKIVLNVPVLYETRTMRWDPADIARARDVMKRLMLYERNLNKLRNEGQAILKDWNGLLGKTAPTLALRADSPTLPYNHSQDEEPGMLPASSTVIKVEQ